MTPNKQAQLQHHLTEIRRSAEERSTQKIAKEADCGYVDVRKTPVSIDALQIISEAEARGAWVAGLQIKVDALAIGAADPRGAKTAEIIKKLEARGFKTKIYAVSKSGISEAWRLYKLVASEKQDITGKVQVEEDSWEKFKEKFTNFKNAESFYKSLNYKELDTTELFETVLSGAMALRGSDIHLEAEEKGARFRYRIDGILHDVAVGVPRRNYDGLISRLKLISGLKINIRTETQDGRFTIRMAKKDIEVRVSIVPSQYGETVVMRLLDPDGINVTLEQLGLRADDYEMVKAELLRPNGLILNTGPTGSGKTTTLYTFLRTVSSPDIKIITIEDPVEYHLPGIEQTQTDSEAGYTFASGLRAMMRQDPDIILVGEIRDLETAEIAMNASLTGHLVFSTLHTNDAIGAVPRLLDLGVKPAILGPALSLVIAQRLVRKLCENCKRKVSPSAEDAAKYKRFLDKLPKRINRAPFAEIKIFEAAGCDKCNGFGYKGRLGIYEFFKKNPELEELISQGVSIISLRKLAREQDMVFLQQDGILKAFLGVTSFEEVVSVTGPIEW